MFEKEAEEYACEYARQYLHNDGSGLTNSYCETYNGYYRGANDGYNKAKEELKLQIEQMKLCQNCRFEFYDDMEEPCRNCSRCLGEDIEREGDSDK